MNDIFQDMSDLFVVVYLNDILVFSESIKLHQGHIWQVLSRLRENNLHVKPKKSLFHTHSIEFLIFMISPTGISMDVAKTKAISGWPVSSNLKQVQSFLRFANFYQCFIVNFSDTVIPLTQLTQKDTNFKWRPEHQATFKKLKLAFVGSTTRAYMRTSCDSEVTWCVYTTSRMHAALKHAFTRNSAQRNSARTLNLRINEEPGTASA